MTKFSRLILFLLFFLSGFASLIFQVVWTRMAFASFGVIAPVLSVVLSTFMLGLAVGSWAGGQMVAGLVKRTRLSAAFFYGLSEFVIGIGAFAVPVLFAVGQRVLLPTGEMDSFRYFALSAIALSASIFPWCVFMGTTFPFMMAYVRERNPENSQSFSFLYLANVLGAMTGTLLTAVVLVEWLGFRHTLWVGAGANFSIAIISAVLGIRQQKRPTVQPVENAAETTPAVSIDNFSDRTNKIVLFMTGFVSMAMEVVWTRGFAVVLKTQVYSFAMIVFTYLGATFFGSLIYRRDLHKHRVKSLAILAVALAIATFIPVLVNDPWFMVPNVTNMTIFARSAVILLFSICPFCALLGYLTPKLVDAFAMGNPQRAGTAYALNVLGCILGPLLAAYLLLPNIGSRIALLILGVPFLVLWLTQLKSLKPVRRTQSALAVVGVLVWAFFFSQDFEEMLLQSAPNSVVRRDYMASVATFGPEPRLKHLLVNGFGMTTLTPITKFMTHLPMVLHKGPVKSVLVICFGMGTTYRSALTWNVDTTAVELVPSVPKAFGLYHMDAEKYLHDPHGTIVIDDGRRYLSRCGKKFDIIIVDPPPPVEAAGSSLLFSNEFSLLAKEHLNPNGILQMWYPGSFPRTSQAVIRSAVDTFPNVRCFSSVEGWGIHILESMEPIAPFNPKEILAKMPASAVTDLLEWTTVTDPIEYLAIVLKRELKLPSLLNANPEIKISDDRPYNEYYLLRELHGK